MSDLAARLTKLRRVGGEFSGLCPFHNENTPSFTINDAKQFYYCFGCGAHGDIIRLARDGFNLTFRAAVEMIEGASLAPVGPAVRLKEEFEDRKRDSENLAAAQEFWEEGGPISGTPADLYLSWRKIYVRPPCIRYGIVPSYRSELGRWHFRRPCLMVKAENLAGEFTGIQRIFLTEDGGKADMPKPKLSLGNVRGASIRLGPPASDVMVIGGPENGLSLWQDFAERVTVYISPGEAMMYAVKLPRLTRAVTVVRQNDAPGVKAAKRAAEEFAQQGRKVRPLAPPPQFNDWNDKLTGAERAAA